MPIKPVHPGDAPLAPGPTATPAEHRWFAEDNAYHSLLKKRWEDWIAAHPDDAEITHAHSFIVPIEVLKAHEADKPPESDAVNAKAPPPPPPPRPDGTSPRGGTAGSSGRGGTGL
jgi:hypothetical protein